MTGPTRFYTEPSNHLDVVRTMILEDLAADKKGVPTYTVLSPKSVKVWRGGMTTLTRGRPVATPETVRKFERLAKEWLEESRSMSSLHEVVELPQYKAIIDLGEDAVPLILEKLEREGAEPSDWFYALHKITGANPVPTRDHGRVRLMATAWIAWGKRRYG